MRLLHREGEIAGQKSAGQTVRVEAELIGFLLIQGDVRVLLREYPLQLTREAGKDLPNIGMGEEEAVEVR